MHSKHCHDILFFLRGAYNEMLLYLLECKDILIIKSGKFHCFTMHFDSLSFIHTNQHVGVIPKVF